MTHRDAGLREVVEGVARILWRAQGHADIVDLLIQTQDKASLDIQDERRQSEDPVVAVWVSLGSLSHSFPRGSSMELCRIVLLEGGSV